MNAHETLTAEDRWLVWRMEQADGRDKPTKVPYNARGGAASSTDPATWSTYEVATTTAQNGGGFNGVGFVLGDRFAGIDLDHCVVDGVIAPWALDIIEYVDSYTELSPTDGIHIHVRGDTALDMWRKRTGNVEMYLTGRYFTYTGRVVRDVPIRDVDLVDVHARLFGPPPPAREPRATTSDTRHTAAPHTDDEIRTAASQINGEKARALLNHEHTKTSEERESLLCILAFYTRDADQLFRLATDAGFDRDDDERKLRNHDIPGALAFVTNAYTWPGVVRPINPSPVDDDEPAEPVTDPAALLDDVATFVRQYSAMTDEQRDTIALWAMHTHVFAAFDITPRLALVSAEKQSGKTRTLEILKLISANAVHTAGSSAPYLFRKIEENPPTLLMDEVDAIFGTKTAEDNEPIRQILNMGFESGATVGRIEGQGTKMRPKDFHVYAPVALAAIGKLPDTVMDRSVIVRMKRRAPGEHTDPYRHHRVAPSGHALRARMAAWADQIREGLREADPMMPDGVTDRPADTWAALLAIADAAGGDWPERARRACVALLASEQGETGSEGEQLLSDIRNVFDTRHEDAISSADLATDLKKGDESVWADLGFGKSLTANGLARLLKKYAIHPDDMRVPGNWHRHVQGYKRVDFLEAWARYLPSADTPTPPPLRPVVLADLDVSNVPF
jgi:hypothetical protein